MSESRSIREIAKKIKKDPIELSLFLSIIPKDIIDKEITAENYFEILEDLEKIDGKLFEILISILENNGKGDPYKRREQKNFIADLFREIRAQFEKVQ